MDLFGTAKLLNGHQLLQRFQPSPRPIELPPLEESCDPDGDMRLTAPVRTPNLKQQKCFVVSSKAMRLACAPWRVMLAPDGPFLEAQKIGQKELSFPDDDAAPLTTLLHIAHLNFDKVPQNMTFRSLLSLAVLTDKYGATRLVRPWIKSWITDVSHLLLDPGYEEWLWIAWEFGQIASFQQLARKLVSDVRMTSGGRFALRMGRILDPLADDSYLPPDIIESILNVRQQVIEDLFEIYRGHIQRFKAPVCGNTFEILSARKKCDLWTFGSLTLPLHQAGLSLETPWTADTNWSIAELSQKLLSIKVVPFKHRFPPSPPPTTGENNGKSHSSLQAVHLLFTVRLQLVHKKGPSKKQALTHLTAPDQRDTCDQSDAMDGCDDPRLGGPQTIHDQANDLGLPTDFFSTTAAAGVCTPSASSIRKWTPI
ncbi:nuclear pore protein [Diplodia corticola]|uniref:Nuclear pore protein n=1 Tax=Diplodia corticola TaxID=236234 RepID=A0A1J9RAH2_9PEZI|nr:nuclear pore protein [Diplodia corticola]OJD38598.1 nuclear pore protein [Diplodia corticola]